MRMIRPSQALRIAHINLILLKHGLDEVILATHLFRPLRFLLYLSPLYWLRGPRAPRAVRIRSALEDLGPIYVKFGQVLSTRRDLLPDDIADEFARLQDKVQPFPGSRARAIIEQAYGRPLQEAFLEFDEQPLASASIAQVHAARLLDGREVVVKVVRPGIEKVIRRDIALLYTVAGLAERYWAESRRLHPREVVAELEKTILDELDLLRESANASQLRRNFQDSPLLYVPEIHWPLTRRNVLVMERIHGTPIWDVEALRRQGVDLRTLAHHGVELFFTQVFEHRFFHADMHPGNIFVSPEGQYIAVDFGIMGSLSDADQRYLAENFLAFFRRDYRRVAELHVHAGWVRRDIRVDDFEAAIRSVCEPVFERPLKDISFGQVLVRLFQTARRFEIEVQPQLILLQKTLLNIEALGRQLYPDLDLWQTAKPFLERWMSIRVGAKALRSALLANAPDWAEKLPHLPLLLHDVLRRVNDEHLRVHLGGDEVERLRRDIRRANQRTVAAITGGASLIAATLILGLGSASHLMVGDVPLLTWLLGSLGLATLMIAWLRN
jgi:ubiquinone biosynthesis protein